MAGDAPGVAPLSGHTPSADDLDYGSIAAGARVLGDTWTLLIVRELLCGATRFNDLHRGLPSLSKSILSSRLRDLERTGVVVRRAIAASSWHEYRLTPLGLELQPVLAAIGEWADVRQQESAGRDACELLGGLARSARLSAIPRGKVCLEFEFPETRGWLHLEARHTRACVDVAERDVDLIVATTVEVLDDLWRGRRECRSSIALGDIRFRGPSVLADGFRTWFDRSTDVAS